MKKTQLKRGTKTMARSGFKRASAVPKSKPKKKKKGKAPKTARSSKMAKKKRLLEKYNLPPITHARWGTAKKPTDTDLLRGMLWHLFSKFIRDRDQEEPCISCRKVYEVKQAGHFVPVGGSSVGVWFDEQNVNGECEDCNAFDQFHLVPMRVNLIKKYGLEVVEDLERRRNQTTKLDNNDYVEKINYYLELREAE